MAEETLSSLREGSHATQQRRLRWKLKSIRETDHTSDFGACEVCTCHKGTTPQGAPPPALPERTKGGGGLPEAWRIFRRAVG